MPVGTLNRDYPTTLWGARVTIPKGTRVHLVPSVGGGWAVSSVALLIRLTGNTWDPRYRHAWVDADAVTPDGNSGGINQ